MIANHLFKFCGYFIQRLIPGYFQEAVAHSFHRRLQPIGIVLVVGYFHAFSTAVTFTSLIVPVRPDFYYPVFVNENFQTTILGATDACCFFPSRHVSSPLFS
jgi:hypothetical protein